MLDEDWSLLHRIYEATTCSKSKHDIPDIQEIYLFLKNIGPVSSELVTQCAIETMNPILFATKYKKDIFTKWSRESNILDSRGFLADDDVIDKRLKKKILIFYKVFANISFIFQACHIYGAECGTFRKNFSAFLSRMEKSLKLSLSENGNLLKDDPFFKCFSETAEPGDKQIVLNAFLIGMHSYFKSMQWDGKGLTISTEVKITDFEEPLSEELRNHGNEEYKKKFYYAAIKIYSRAIAINRYRYILYGNRSQAFIKVQRWDEAELDARRALLLNPAWFKGYYRLAHAYKGQERIHEAHIVIDFMKKSCISTIPNDDYREIFNFQESLKKECLACCPISKRRIKKMEVENNQKDTKLKKTKNNEPHSENIYQEDTESVETRSNETLEEIQDEDKQPSSLDIFKKYCKEGSDAFHSKDYELSIQKYRDALKLLNSGCCPEVSPSEIFILKYCLSKSLVASNYRKTIKEAISLLENIKDIEGLFHSLAYYGIAKAYAKLNKYKDALPIISLVLSTLKPGSQPKHLYSYPQHNAVLEESDPTFLQEKLQDLQAQCTYAPPPIGTCRYNHCPLELDIYATNPEYKGYYIAKCSDNCVLHYHPSCWKSLLASLGSEHQKKTDKDMLSHGCFTPDCFGTFISIKNYDNRGDIVRVFEMPHKTENTKKKKSKTEKRAEQKKQQQLKKKSLQHDAKHMAGEEQKRTSLSQQDDEEADPHCEGKVAFSRPRTYSNPTPLPPSNPPKPQEPIATPNPPAINCPLYNVNDEPEIILKKSDIQEETVSKKKKKKKTKKLVNQEKPNIEIPQIYHSDKERVKKLEEVKRATEEGMDIKYIERYASMVSEAPSDTLPQPQATAQSIDNLQQMEEIETTLISFLLNTNGPVSLEDLHLHKALTSLSSECQQYLENIGGLKNFVGKSSQFVLVNGMIHFATQIHQENTLQVYSANGCDDMATLDGFDDMTEPEIMTDQEDDNAFELSSENDEYMSDESLNDADMISHHNNFDINKHSAKFYKINKKVETLLNNVRLVIDSNISIDELPLHINTTQHSSFTKSTNSYCLPSMEHVSSHYPTIPHLPEQKLDTSNLMKKLSSDVLLQIMATIKECNDEKASQIFAKVFWDDLNKSFPAFYKDATGRLLMDQSPTFLEEAKKNKELLHSLNKQKEALEFELTTMLENHAQLKKTKAAEINSLRESLSNQETLLQKKCEEMASFKSELESQKNKWELERLSLLEDLKKAQTAFKEVQHQKAELQLKFNKVQRALDASNEEIERLEKDLSDIKKAFGRLLARASNAEDLVLQFKKQEGINFVNRPLEQTREKIKSLTIELESACKYKDADQRIKTQKLLNEWKNYELKLLEAKNDFLARIEREVRKISRKEEPEFVELPKIPTPPQDNKTIELVHSKDELALEEMSFHHYELTDAERKEEEEEVASEASAALAMASRSTSISEMDDELDLPLAMSSSATSHDTLWLSESTSAATPALLTEQDNPNEDSLELPCATPLDSVIEISPNVLPKSSASTKPKLPLKSTDKSSQKGPTSYLRLITLLEREYPKLTRNQLDDYIKKYRALQTKLSGKKLPQIVADISAMIEQTHNASKEANENKPKAESLIKRTGGIVLKKLVREPPKQPPKSEESGWKTVKGRSAAWNRLPPKKPTFTGMELEQCVICFEEIDPSENEKLECGHNFHSNCIRLWLCKNKSTCPMCNTHVLLQDEFPQL